MLYSTTQRDLSERLLNTYLEMTYGVICIGGAVIVKILSTCRCRYMGPTDPPTMRCNRTMQETRL